MPEVGVSAAVAAIELVQLAHKQGWFDRLITALRKKHRVLVLGPTGTGKTLFLKSLTEAVPEAIDLMSRTEFVDAKHIRISKQPFVFIDTPGQTLHRSRRIQAIREEMKNDIAGVINVVSYGYHESRAVNRKGAIANGRVDKSFLERQRQQEMRQLHEWTPLLGAKETTGWLITVVAKADLWWGQRNQVRKHYESGAYYEALGPAKELNPVVLEYCSVFQKFYGEVRMSGEFQDRDRDRARADILREILAAIGRK